MPKIDHDLDSNNAAGFRKSSGMAARMLRRAEGEIVDVPKPASTPPTDHSYVPTAQPHVDAMADNTVTIENKNIRFEVAYPYDTKLMSVGLKAMSVDVSEDSVSILMQDTVSLKLPKLVPLHLKVDGIPYKVCWAGGAHNFGRFKHISFVVVE